MRIQWIGLAVVGMAMATCGATAVYADESKTSATLSSLWTVPKEEAKMVLLVAGKQEPITVAVSDKTIFAGICLDCNLPLEFKPADASKKCLVCGCVVSNAACIVGKPVKEGTWQAMMKGLPRGVALHPTYITADKPESGLTRLVVDLRAVLLPVTGIEAMSPDQLLVIAKPFGAVRAELIDGGKRLSLRLKTDWTADREGKLEKALAKANGKVVVPEDEKPAN